jgi:hypothetical protein
MALVRVFLVHPQRVNSIATYVTQSSGKRPPKVEIQQQTWKKESILA